MTYFIETTIRWLRLNTNREKYSGHVKQSLFLSNPIILFRSKPILQRLG